jgi:hypothetical protein
MAPAIRHPSPVAEQTEITKKGAPQPFAKAEQDTPSESNGVATTTASVEAKDNVQNSRIRLLVSRFTYTPERVRWDPENPPQFSMGLNVLFAFAGCFTVACLYYVLRP